MTLIEVMMVVAMGSIIITAAVAVIAAALRLKQNGERNLEVQLSSNVAAIAIQADMMNAGYRFAAPAYAIRHHNNVNGTTSLSSPLGPITTSANCGTTTAGLEPGSDVIEIAEGAQNTALASSTSGDGVDSVIPNGALYDVTLRTGAPFDPFEAPASRVGQILLFVDMQGLACMGRVVASGSSNSASLEMLDQDFQINGSHSSNYVGANACPKANMTVYRLGQRVRYFVCRPPAATNLPPSLYRQFAGINGNFGLPEMVQEGIEDLQVSLRQWNPPGPGLHGGPSCVIAPNNQGYCYCNDGPGTASSCDAAEPTPFLTASSHATKVRGARVMITAVSRRRAHNPPAPDDLRPAAYDHPAATGQPDGFARVQQQFSLVFNNFALVSP